jgi:hypothetical protein
MFQPEKKKNRAVTSIENHEQIHITLICLNQGYEDGWFSLSGYLVTILNLGYLLG